MKLSQVKNILKKSDTISFKLPNGKLVPAHFHVTEIGKVSKDFIDCGGTVRNETVVNFQLWEANDYNHRLHPEKLIHIIELSEKKLDIPDLHVEIEYQSDTIGRYDLGHNGSTFVLNPKKTACLALDSCKIPEPIISIASDITSCCKPESGCC